MKDRHRKRLFLGLTCVVFACLLVLLMASVLVFCAACKPPAATMIITGVAREMATPYETGNPAKNVEVKLYTYREPALPQLPPVGDVIASSTTDERGKYKFEVELKILPKNCYKLVVFVDRGYMGWKTVTVSAGAIQVDLAKGSIPLPAKQ